MPGRKIRAIEKVKTIKQSATYVIQELHITHASARNLSFSTRLLMFRLTLKIQEPEIIHEQDQ